MKLNKQTGGWLGNGLRAGACAAIVFGGMLAGPMLSPARADDDKGTQADAKPEMLDVIIFRNGNKVEGKVLSETEMSVTVRVMFSGISTETVYQKSEILEIKRGAIKVAPKTEDAKKDGERSDDDKKAAKVGDEDDGGKLVDINGKAIPEGNMKVYFVPLKGEFGRDLSFVSLERIIEDMERVQPDVVVFQFGFDFAMHGQEFYDYAQRGSADAWNQLETATDMAEVLFRKVQSGSFTTKPRMVAWVKKALGGAAFFPCAFPEIYFTPDGLQGGIGGLDVLFKGVGDEVAQEKQRSLRLARARGLAELGGHDSRFVEAMTRRDYWLSYKIEGGNVVLKTDRPESPDWILLKDDGQEERADSAQDMMRMQGNDYLTFNAKTAQTLGWSKGSPETLDDLLFQMSITRNFSQVKTKAPKILKERSKEIGDGEKQLRDLLDKYQRTRVKEPGGYRERTAFRGQRIQILKQMISIVKRYEKEINPRAVPGWPGDLEVTIRQLELDQRNDRP